MSSISRADLETALGFVSEAGNQPDVATFVAGVFEGFAKLIPADLRAYTEVRAGRVMSVTDPGDVLFAGSTEILARLWHENPLIVYGLRSSAPAPRRISDFLTARDWRRREVCRTLYEPIEGGGDQLAISLKRRGMLVGLTLNRKRGVFSDRDCELLGVVGPHLVRSYENAIARQRLRERIRTLEAQVPAHADAELAPWVPGEASGALSRLTPREAEVLHYVSEGMTNRAVAAHLGITPRTVKKHLEGCYEKLGVSNRTAAVSRLLSWSGLQTPRQ